MPVYADEKHGLKTILGAQLLRAAEGQISEEDYKKLSFNRCAAIKKYQGFSDDELGQAIEYSCKGLMIGITYYAGADLGKHSPEKVAQFFKDRFAENAITAEVFIKPNHEYGSAMAFFINGESYWSDWARPTKGVKSIDGISAEAKLIYFNNKQITPGELKAWSKNEAPPKIIY